MKCVFLVGLVLLQAVYAAKNITVSIDIPKENPADVSYVNGKAPEELKAGPAKTTTTKPKETIVQAAFIRSSNREIPKDDEIENEEFERFIQKYHSGPTIETVFVSTSPSPPAEDSEELNEEDKTTEPQAEVFKRPSAQLRTFERSVAHPTLTSHILPPPEHHQNYAIVHHQPHDASVHHGGGSVSFAGSDGYVFQAQGGGGASGQEGFILQSGGGDGGHGQFVLADAHGGGGGDQQYYQYANFVPNTFNVAQNAIKTRTYEIRRPAIQKHYYDIEERVIVRPAGSVIVELDRPVAKVPTGETVVAVGGLTGSFIGNGFQQSSQGGISFANAFGGGYQGGQVDLSQGGYPGSGITYASSVGIPSQSGSGAIGGIQQSQGGLVGGGAQGGIGFQQSQGAIGIGGTQGGIGIQQSQGGIAFSTSTPSSIGGFQQSQGGLGGSGVTFTSSVGLPSQSGGSLGGFQQSQGGLGGGAQGGIGFQQSQGSIGGSQGGIGIQQSQGGIAISTTTPSPNGSPSSTTVVIGTQQQQGAVGGSGFQQSQSGIAVSTTPAPSVTQTSSTAGTLFGGGANGGFSGIGIQHAQGGIGISQGGISGAGFQQSQGGATYSTTTAPGTAQTASTTNIFVGGPNGGFPLTGSGTFGAGSSLGGFQQSQGGGAVYSTTGVPYFPSTTPSPYGGGFSGAGFQQSQGGIGISQGGGGFSGAGFQQSQGGVYSTTPAPYLPPPAPTPTVLIGRSNGGYSGAGFQQSQSGIGISQGGSQGGFAGAGFQQSQGGIGLGGGGGFAGFQQSQGGIGLSQGDIAGSGFQTSSSSIGLTNGGSFGGGEITYSTTSSPSYSLSGSRSILLRPQHGGGYPVVSTTTGGPIIITALNGNSGNSFEFQANSNVQNKGSVSSTTTTERTFSVSQDASAFAKASSSGSIDAASNHIRFNPPRNPNFSYPPYVEISSNGSPLGHLRQQPYTQAPSSQDYPRMRYQGKLLTGEVHVDDGLAEQHESQQQGYGALSSHHQNYENPTLVAEIPPNSPQEEHSLQFAEHNPENQHQIVGSSKQLVQDSQISSGSHQQPDQVHQYYYVRANSQPIVSKKDNSEQHNAQQQTFQHHAAQQHAAQQHAAQQLSAQQYAAQLKAAQQQSAQQHHVQPNDIHPISNHHYSAPQQQVLLQSVANNQQGHPQQSAQQYIIPQHQPTHRANYQSRSHHYNDLQFFPTTSVNQEHAAQVSNQQPIHHNLVAHIRHQQPSSQVQAHRQQAEHHEPTESTHSKQQQVTESLEEPIEVSEVHSSTHQQPTMFQQQVSTTVHTLEPYNSGRRQYKQRVAPQKYTQDQSLNVAPSEHTVYFNNNLEHTSARSQNIEIPPEQEETSGKSVESTALPILTTTTQRLEATTQRQTYASVLAQGKPGILYAPPKPAARHHSPGHRQQHFLRFSADGSTLFSPSGRQVHFVYSQPQSASYPHQSPQTHSVPPAPIEPAKQHISVTNKGYQIQTQLPIMSQSQIKLNANHQKPAPASEPQITRSQSHAASHQTSARYEAISSTTPETATITKEHQHHQHKHQQRGPQKYRNEQTHGAITLRSGRTYGDHRVIASTPAPSDGGAASESVQTRRIVVNHPFQTVQEVVEREPFTNIHQVTVNAPAKQVQQPQQQQQQHGSNLEEGQQKSAPYRVSVSAPYKVAAVLNHPQATLNFQHHGGSH